MKILFVSILTCLSTLAIGQKKIKVDEKSENIGGGKNNALTVLIYEASANDVEKEWKTKVKDYRGKVGSQKGEIFADDAVVKEFGEHPVDIYAKVIDNKDGSVTLVVAYDLGGAFLSSSAHSDKFKDAKDMVYNFAVSATKNAIGNQLKEAEKQQKKLEKEQEDLVKQKESLEKDIADYKEKIKQAESNIQNNSQNQEKKKAEIETQKKAVEAISGKLKAVN